MAGTPSPDHPTPPLPATVEILPGSRIGPVVVEVTMRMRWFQVSAMYRFIDASKASLYGSSAAPVAGPPSPSKGPTRCPRRP